MEAAQLLKEQAWKWHSIVSATYSSPKKVTKPLHIQEQGKETLDAKEPQECEKWRRISSSHLSTMNLAERVKGANRGQMLST